jgi:hypothetical protein
MKQRGYILLATLLVISLLLVFGIYIGKFYSADKQIAQNGKNQLIAISAADAGIQDALYQLKRNSAWNAGFSSSVLPHSLATYTVTFDKTQNKLPWSTNNSTGGSAIAGYGGRSVPAGMVHLVSLGMFQSSTVKVEALLQALPGSLFPGAVTTQGDITISGNQQVDFYDSTAGPYAPPTTFPAPPVNLLTTNSAAAGAVDLNGHVTIAGAGTVGPGGTSASVSGTGYQSWSAETKPVAMSFITAPTGTNLGDAPPKNLGNDPLPVGTYQDLNPKGDLTLLPGTYVFTGDMTLSGKDRILLDSSASPTNPVKIFVLGSIAVTGNSSINGTTQGVNGPSPSSLIIYGGPNTTDVKLSGSTNSYFALYAPAADVRISGGADLFGAVVSNTLTLSGGGNGGGIHFDQSLSSGGSSGSGSVVVKSRW